MCGFIGIYGPDGVDVASEIYEGLLAIQHRGQDAAGIVTFTDRFHIRKAFGLVLQVFREEDMRKLQGNLGVGHVRYPTVGGGGEEDAQPFHLTFPVGIAMAHNGNVTNTDELLASLGTRLNSSCDVEIILMVFARALSERLEGQRGQRKPTAEDVFAAIEVVFAEVGGAYSVVAVIPDVGLVAFRDPYGIKPICLGRKTTEEGPWHAVVSESVVLDVGGFERVRDLAPGEAILIGDDREVVSRQLVVEPSHRPCIFEMVYFARPDSFLDEISVYKTRRRFGAALAQQWRDSGGPMPDVVIPIPDSSRDSAMELARALGVPYREGLVKNRYIGRTFIMPNQTSRSTSIRRKLNPIPLEFEGKNVMLVDDSIVRGNTSRRIVRMARDSGAKAVYFAVTSPPLVAQCPYGVDMASRREFIATDLDVDAIARSLEVDHLLYLDREAMNGCASAGNPDITEFCNACFTGVYPTPDVTRERLEAIEEERARHGDRIPETSP